MGSSKKGYIGRIGAVTILVVGFSILLSLPMDSSKKGYIGRLGTVIILVVTTGFTWVVGWVVND
jgi:hypothetical protein